MTILGRISALRGIRNGAGPLGGSVSVPGLLMVLLSSVLEML